MKAKTLSVKDLSQSTAVRLFELGYNASRCRNPEQFRSILKILLEIFPADAVVCGYGKYGKDVDVTALWNSSQLAGIDIIQLEALGWPKSFLETYVKEDLLSKDGHSYECIRTQQPVLWSDVLKRDGHPFNAWTKRGLDPKFVEIVQDHRMSLVLRKTHVNKHRLISDFSLLFRRRKTVDQFKSLWNGVVPYLQNALLNAHQATNGTQPAGARSLSPRQREVLKWLIEGKSNWEIGKILNISERTVKFHAQLLMRKFDATNRSHLVANALAQSALASSG